MSTLKIGENADVSEFYFRQYIPTKNINDHSYLPLEYENRNKNRCKELTTFTEQDPFFFKNTLENFVLRRFH